jgi:GT2 family glycosyltransferase
MKELPLVSVVIPTHNRKHKLIRLINSIVSSNYLQDKLEIIVVDDFSNDGTYTEIKKTFPQVKVLRNEEEKYLSASRNMGIKVSSGDFILLIDDDNAVEKNMIRKLSYYMKNHEEVGVCAPLMLYYGTNNIWCAGIRRNMVTSKTDYLLNGEILGKVKLPETIFSDDFPNCFMVRLDIVRKYNILFDEKLFPIHFNESDFCYRIAKLGYQVVCYTETIEWHDVRRSKIPGFETEMRTRLTARNRILFHRKYSKRWQFLIFSLIFNWIFTFYYLKEILLYSGKNFNKKLAILDNYLKGIWDGFTYAY